MSKRQKTKSGVGERVAIARDKRHLSQEQLAAEAGVDRVTVARIESGAIKRGRADTLQALARSLGVSVDYLLGKPTVSPVEPAIQSYLRSGWVKVDEPTDDEIAWIRAQDSGFWQDAMPEDEHIHDVLRLHRKFPRRR